MTSYLSSRHHQETWVKDGYLQIDDSPIDNKVRNGGKIKGFMVEGVVVF
jgi:hypothetical protein